MQSITKATKIPFHRSALPAQSLLLFLRQLAVLADGTMPLDIALHIIAESGANKAVRRAADELHRLTMEGQLLSDAMRLTERFSPVLVAMVQTGEESGNLGPILTNYASALERQEQTRRKVQQAMIYPVVLTVVSISVVTFLLLFVIPSFVRLFSDAGMQLPLPTRILLDVSGALSKMGLWLLLFPLVTLGCFIGMHQRASGKRLLHRIKRKIPFFGPLHRDMQTAQLAELMALFFENNVDIVRFLSILATGAKQIPEKEALAGIHAQILEGAAVCEAFQSSGYYNPVFTGMLRTGEVSGRLSEVTHSIANYLNLEVQLRLNRGTSLLEPALILILSLMVGFIVLAIALPMFQMVHLYDF